MLLARVLTPEAALLRLHQHQHTEDAPVVVRTAKLGPQAMLSAKHQHCHVDNLYNAPFAPAAPVRLAEPVRLLFFAEYRPQAPVCRASHLLEGASLRGPPTARA
ncbi:hypothetical protein [Hymenobacter cellulosivorans]|uniref:Uncharacterized protein n=1 Tax=Hymenobacter cellulosivorans TaxID=2932249 RepID=A0ABY4F6P8_9BACT|nr:hypothetical protein [Hymenobacter cellulosivorans]UOQ52341.1 hypothetical protein MUN80_21600 [Hymenobacter cellulosivorans]